MDNQPISYSLDHQPSNKNKTLMIVVIVIVVLALLAGGYYFFTQQTKKSTEEKVTPTPISQPTEAPSPTKKPIDRSKIKVQVLNGTGTPGEAKKAVDALVKAGYDADNIKTGNAEDYDHTSAEIQAKADMDDVIEDVKKSLESTFEKIEIDSKDLESKSEFDVIVTTGGKIFETPTGKPTVKPTTGTTSTTPSPTGSLTGTLTPTKTPSPTP